MVFINKINKIICYSLQEQRHLSSKEMLELIELLLKKYRLNDIVKNVELDYSRRMSGFLASFDNRNKLLYFNMCEMNSQNFYQYEVDEDGFSFNEVFLINQLITILHEIRHIMQYNNGIRSNALRDIIMDSNIGNYPHDIYNKYYKLFPIEKDATIFSIEQTISLLKNTNYFDNSELKGLYVLYFFNMIDGYDLKTSFDGSIKQFYQLVVGNYAKYLKIIENVAELSIRDKMAFNLPISPLDIEKFFSNYDLVNHNINSNDVLKKLIKKNKSIR